MHNFVVCCLIYEGIAACFTFWSNLVVYIEGRAGEPTLQLSGGSKCVTPGSSHTGDYACSPLAPMTEPQSA